MEEQQRLVGPTQSGVEDPTVFALPKYTASNNRTNTGGSGPGMEATPSSTVLKEKLFNESTVTEQAAAPSSARMSLSEQAPAAPYGTRAQGTVSGLNEQSHDTTVTEWQNRPSGMEANTTDSAYETVTINEIIKRCYLLSKKIDDERDKAMGKKV